MDGPERNSPEFFRWQSLAQLALHGLRATYAHGLPHTMKWNGAATPAGFNVRYALISLLGLGRARSLGMECDDLVEALWSRIETRRDVVDRSPGDLGLALWAQSVSGSRSLFSAEAAVRSLQGGRSRIDSVHLAWLMLGADHALFDQSDAMGEALAVRAKTELLELYNPKARLFYRHSRRGLVAGVSRRVPCFANQIYPVMALAVHARRTGDDETAQVGRNVADNLCAMQGDLGQWWWLYDARDGGVVDGYPVFSVHQDGMAPMALMETTQAGGRPYSHEIAKSLSWIDGANELAANMVQEEAGLVLRDIHRQGVGRIGRAARSAAWCWGFAQKQHATHAVRTEINPECRPYHLGWILYAASLACADARSRLCPMLSEGV